MKKKHKKSVWDILLGIIYDAKTSVQTKTNAIKLYADLTVVKQSHQTVDKEIRHYGPVEIPPLNTKESLEEKVH